MKGKNRREYGKIIECLLSNDEEVNILGLALLKKKALYQNLSKLYKYDGYSKRYRVGYYMRDTLTAIRGNSIGFTPYNHHIKFEVENCINNKFRSIKYIRDWVLSWLLLSLRNKYNINWKL